jgi:hypothetical protein
MTGWGVGDSQEPYIQHRLKFYIKKMRTYLRKRDKRNEEERSLEAVKEGEMKVSMNLQAPSIEVLKIREKEEKTRKAAARQMWKPEKKARRRTTFTKSLT